MLVCTKGHNITVSNAKFCPECGLELLEQVGPIDVILYVHRGKDENYDMANRIGLDPDATRTFAWTGSEVSLQCVVDTQTGTTVVVGINDNGKTVKLEHPVEI